jgi:hypothetical protein
MPSGDPSGRSLYRHATGRVLAPAAGLAGFAVLAAGCGGAKAPSVARLGATSPPSPSASPCGNGRSTGIALQSGTVTYHGGGLAFSSCSLAACAQGVPNVPDPIGQVATLITSSSGIAPNSPQFGSAEEACQSLSQSATPNPTLQAQAQQEALKHSACIRARGAPNSLDPVFSDGNISFPSSGIDRSSPLFQSAQNACQNYRPGRGTG